MVPGDELLWAKAADGDHEAFSALFERHVQAIYNFCFRRTADWSSAEDLAATVFLEAWRCRRRGQTHSGSILPWLYGIATNVVRNDRRRFGRRLAALRRIPRRSPSPDFADDAGARIDDQREMRELLAALEELPPAELDVLVLCLWQELSYEAAATALAIPVGTVRSRLARARARLHNRREPAPTLLLGPNGDLP
jgi:RNA polymerase sigma-70 factor (ECF subfamily)